MTLQIREMPMFRNGFPETAAELFTAAKGAVEEEEGSCGHVAKLEKEGH
jgi:hypothetical protein